MRRMAGFRHHSYLRLQWEINGVEREAVFLIASTGHPRIPGSAFWLNRRENIFPLGRATTANPIGRGSSSWRP
jgi:hypothetical protein